MITFIGNRKQEIESAYVLPCIVYTVTEALALAQWPGVVKLVCDTLNQEEFDAVLARGQQHGVAVDFTNLQQIAPMQPEYAVPRPDFDEQLVAANCGAYGASLAWYTQLLTYALGKDQPNQCCVLWGPPGVGKTLATERIEEMLRRRRVEGGMGGKRLNGTTVRLTGVQELRRFSFADAEDNEDMTALVQAIKLYCVSAETDSIVIIDDVDVLPNGSALRHKLFKALPSTLCAKTKRNRCRVIVVLEDWWSRANAELRKAPLKDHYHDIYVGNANSASLVTFMMKKFPALPFDVLSRIAEGSRGDVRAALTTAKLTQASGGKLVWGERDGSAHTREHGAVHSTLVRVLGDRVDPVKAAHSVFYDHDTETAAEQLFANCPRLMNYTGDDDEFSRSSRWAIYDAVDFMSLASVYDEKRRENFFSGADATNVDKDILFALQIEAPLTIMSRKIRSNPRHYAPYTQFDLPFLNVRKRIEASNDTLAFFARHELVDHWRRDAPISTDLETRQLEADDRPQARSNSIALRLADMGNLLMGRLYKRALCELWCETVAAFSKQKRVLDFSSLPQSVQAITRLVMRAHEAGVGAEALAWLCLWRLDADGVDHARLTYASMVSTAETIIGCTLLAAEPDNVEAVEQEKKRAKKSADVKKGQRTIHEMYAKIKPK